jgi:hypothetical protein
MVILMKCALFRYCFVLTKREIVAMPTGGIIFQRKTKFVT